jgi:hypothetical protein
MTRTDAPRLRPEGRRLNKFMAHHKRRRPKNTRAGCLLCKPHKMNGIKKRVRLNRMTMTSLSRAALLVLSLAAPAVAQVPTYTNADLGHPRQVFVPTNTADE